MESTASESRCFQYAIAWWQLMGLVVVSIPLLLCGWAIGWVGVLLGEVSWWWLGFPAIGVIGIGGVFVLAGVGALLFVVWAALLRVIRWPVVRVTPEGLWLSRYIGVQSVFVPFGEVVWVKRETPDPSVDYVWIVHGANLQTECVAKLALRPVDYDSFLALLIERCPQAHTLEPPANWQRPYD
jgi:hypothetical protein